mgnify:CR=1 FL=1
MTGIEGLFETLTTEAQEAANQHVKYKELGSCLPDYHKAANGTNGGTNGATNGIKQTNGNGNNQSWVFSRRAKRALKTAPAPKS